MNCLLSLFENTELDCSAFAILLRGFAFLTGHSRPYFRISLLIFFLFMATPQSFGINMAMVLDPFGLPLKS